MFLKQKREKNSSHDGCTSCYDLMRNGNSKHQYESLAEFPVLLSFGDLRDFEHSWLFVFLICYFFLYCFFLFFTNLNFLFFISFTLFYFHSFLFIFIFFFIIIFFFSHFLFLSNFFWQFYSETHFPPFFLFIFQNFLLYLFIIYFKN